MIIVSLTWCWNTLDSAGFAIPQQFILDAIFVLTELIFKIDYRQMVMGDGDGDKIEYISEIFFCTYFKFLII